MGGTKRLSARGSNVARPSARGRSGGGRAVPPAAATARRRSLTAAELAWVALVPCGVVAVLAIALLGPPLGHALFQPGSETLWPPGWWETEGHPEPVKHGRYLLAALAPLLLAVAILVSPRWDVQMRPQIVRAIVFASYALVSALVAVSLLDQNLIFDARRRAPAIFALGTVITAASLMSVAMLGMRQRGMTARLAELSRETRTRRVAGLTIAVLFIDDMAAEGRHDGPDSR